MSARSAPILENEATVVESRLFAAKVFADRVLPDIGITLAAFASDDPAGAYRSKLPQSPVAFLPELNPGVLVNRPEVFDQLGRLAVLSGGVAPLHAAILSSIDFVADRAIPGTRSVLVVLANGRDDACGTRRECESMRDAIAERMRARGVELVLVDNFAATPDSAFRSLAVELSIPLVVGSGRHVDDLQSLDLVRQLLGDSIAVLDVKLRLLSEQPDTFYPGAIVKGSFLSDNSTVCPWDCWPYEFPFSVRVP